MTISTAVFIDRRVSTLQPQLSGLDARTTLTQVLQADQNGLSQMRDALAGLSGLEAIHIISHGNAGALQLGNLWLTGSNLSNHTASLSTLGQSLLPTGDVLLYGCNVGQGTVGQQFVAALSQATGADVAASTNPTGQGGDWALELQTGPIAAATLAATGYTGSVALNGGNHSLIFADRSYTMQVPVVPVEFRVNTTTIGEQSAPAVTALSGGGYVVTWQSNPQDSSGQLRRGT